MGRRLNAFRGLLADAMPVWLGIGGVVAAIVLSTIPTVDAEKRVVYGGVWLQLFGLVSVAVGFADRQKVFGLPSVRSRVMGWLSRLWDVVTSRPQHIVGGGASALGSASLSATGTVAATITNPSLERQVELLRQEIGILRGEMDKRFVENDQRVAVLQTRMDDDKDARLRDHAALASKIHHLAVGDLDYEVVGFVWLVLSTFATTIPSDVVWVERLLFW